MLVRKGAGSLVVWETVARNYFFIFSLLPKFGYSLNDDHCLSCCMLSLIRLYLDDIVSKCNRAASCLFMKELALFRCARQLLESISSFLFSALDVWVFFLQSLISQTVLCVPLTVE